MGEDSAQIGYTEAQAMLDTFASVGATRFDVTWTTRAGDKEYFRRSVRLAALSVVALGFVAWGGAQKWPIITVLALGLVLFSQLAAVGLANSLRSSANSLANPIMFYIETPISFVRSDNGMAKNFTKLVWRLMLIASNLLAIVIVVICITSVSPLVSGAVTSFAARVLDNFLIRGPLGLIVQSELSHQK